MFRKSSGRRSKRYLVIVALMLAMLLVQPVGLALANPFATDVFSTSQSEVSSQTDGTSASSQVSGSDILGGFRDIKVTATSGAVPGFLGISADVTGGTYNHSQDDGVEGTSIIAWDGDDDPSTVDTTGLGGVDLTAGGNENSFDFTINTNDQTCGDIIITYYDTDGNSDSVTLADVTGTGDRSVLYSSFSGVDFTKAGAVTYEFNGVGCQAWDVSIDAPSGVTAITLSSVSAHSVPVGSAGVPFAVVGLLGVGVVGVVALNRRRTA